MREKKCQEEGDKETGGKEGGGFLFSNFTNLMKHPFALTYQVFVMFGPTIKKMRANSCQPVPKVTSPFFI